MKIMLTRLKILGKLASLLICLIAVSQSQIAFSQGLQNWSPQQRIPGYSNDTEPPFLIADQNHIIHAFTSQWITTNGGVSEFAIIYSRWTLDQGWTKPNDIVLSPYKHMAQILSVFLDRDGIFHLVFLGGNNTGASIYYSKASALNVDKASAWSAPVEVGEDALSPGSGAIVGDDKGKLTIVFGGTRDGNGVYGSSSSDGGSTWSNPELIFLAQSDQPVIYNLEVYLGQSGWLHAIWNDLDVRGQGKSIYYARTKIGDVQWSEPIKLAESQSGYGVLTPAIIEYQNVVFALFNRTPQIIMRRSNDDGATWADPVVPFEDHIGVNGTLSLVVDGENELNLFFGQRIPGSPDIHGMWHAIWQTDGWSVPEPVESGPRIMTGDNQSFDPFNARAASVDNVLLVTWRTDPGNGVANNNGVWYSFKSVGPGTSLGQSSTASQLTPTTSLQSATPTPPPKSVAEYPYISPSVNNNNSTMFKGFVNLSDPLSAVGLGIIPVLLMIIGIIIVTRRSHH
jgi:hypothetical protein